MITSSSDIRWEEQKINRWILKNHSLPSSVAKVYEDTKISHRTHAEPYPTIENTLFIQCIPDCDNCDGYVVIVGTNRRYKCGCIHHSLSDLDKPRI
jgi:hypothetical protein